MEKLLERIKNDIDFAKSPDSVPPLHHQIILNPNEAQSLIDYIKALEEYNEFLTEDIDRNSGFLVAHGIYTSPVVIKTGEKLRETISSIKAKTF